MPDAELRYSHGMKKLRALWFGKLPLAEAFWTWVVAVGLVVNLASSVAFLALISADLPWAAIFVGYVLSVPYNVLAVVGLWRSAAAYTGKPRHADLARLVTVVLMLVLTLT